MHLVSCEHPKRVYNKYINEYIWVGCGKCNACKNSRAYRYTTLLERERLQHRYSFFVTLTYDPTHLPVIYYPDYSIKHDLYAEEFVSSRSRDSICITYNELFPTDKSADYDEFDIQYFKDNIQYGGLPYASKTDVQLFLKRLNKYIHDNITHTFKNFRYFIVSEYGSTTFRPHLHGIFYCDNPKLGDKFYDALNACWRFGYTDCKPVESSACAYCAQYINKSTDLPYVYQNSKISPFFLCSRNPFIGTYTDCAQNDAEIIDKCSVEISVREKASSTKFVNVPLYESYQNRLFPKCPCYSSVSDTVRTKLYTTGCRFKTTTLKDFINDVYDFIYTYGYMHRHTELYDFLSNQLSLSKSAQIAKPLDYRDASILFDTYSYNWIRRWFYLVKKVIKLAFNFGYSLSEYIQKIFSYYEKRKLYVLNKFYQFQEKLSETESESLCLLYPEYLYQNGIYSLVEYAKEMNFVTALNEISTNAFYAFQNKKTHFKNAYIESIEFRVTYPHLFKILKTYFYGKKRNEVIEALSTQAA